MGKMFQSTRFWQVITLLLLALFISDQANLNLGRLSNTSNKSGISFVKTVQASEIYPMFTCPCCDQPLDKEEPCCGAMIAMIEYIDEQVELGKAKDEIILSTAREFGLDRLANEEDIIALKQKLADLAPDDAPKIEIDEVNQDLGTVSQDQGVVSTDFKFSNQGKSDLIINKLSSSCGCTSAVIVYQDNIGPKFTMAGHGQENPTDWEVAIEPGESAILRVYYDPSVHPDFEGAATRTV